MTFKASLVDGTEIKISLSSYVPHFNRIHIGLDGNYENPVDIEGAHYYFFEKDIYYVFSKNKWDKVELSGFEKYAGKDLLLAEEINLLDFFVEVPYEQLTNVPENKKVWVSNDEIYTRKILKCVESIFVVAPFNDAERNKDIEDLQPYRLGAQYLEIFNTRIETLLNTYKRMFELIK